MPQKIIFVVTAVFCILIASIVNAAEVGLVTSVSGRVLLQVGTAPSSDLKAFIKIRKGDRITLSPVSQLQLVFFENGRQETWRGSGTIELGEHSGKILKGTPQIVFKTLPDILIKQLSKTPYPDGTVKAGMIRVRSISQDETNTVESVERKYAELHRVASAGDHTAEAYLLAGYLELKAFDRISKTLARLKQEYPSSADIRTLENIYRKAMQKAAK